MKTRIMSLTVLLASCSAPPSEPGRVVELRREASRGTEAFRSGDLRIARAAFERRLELARAADDAHEIGNAAHDLATVCLETADGADDRVTALMQEARLAFARALEPEASVEVDLLEVRMHLLAHDGEAASRILSAIESLPQLPIAIVARARLARVELESSRGDAQAARTALEDACVAIGQPLRQATSPELLLGLAQVENAEGEAAASAATFDRAATQFRELGLYRHMAHAIEQAGDASTKAGQTANATERWLRAAITFQALGDRARASELAARALTTAQDAGDDSTALRARAVLAG